MSDMNEQRPVEHTQEKPDLRNMEEWPKDPQPGSFRDKLRNSRFNDGSAERTTPTAGERIKDAAYNKTPERFKNASDLQIRFRTGVIYIGLTLAGIFIGGWGLVAMLAITAGICAGEFYFMLRKDSKLPNEVLGIVAAMAFPVAAEL